MDKKPIKQTSDIHKIRQSINAKTERSEQDVIRAVKEVVDASYKRLNYTLGALFFMQLVVYLVLLINL